MGSIRKHDEQIQKHLISLTFAFGFFKLSPGRFDVALNQSTNDLLSVGNPVLP